MGCENSRSHQAAHAGTPELIPQSCQFDNDQLRSARVDDRLGVIGLTIFMAGGFAHQRDVLIGQIALLVGRGGRSLTFGSLVRRSRRLAPPDGLGT